MENYFEIGKITGTHGIRGTMRVFLYSLQHRILLALKN